MSVFTIPQQCEGNWFGGAVTARELPVGRELRSSAERVAWFARPDLAPAAVAAGLDAVPVLESLHVSGAGSVDEEVAAAIARHPGLTSLTLERVALTEALAARLATAPRLRDLAVTETALPDEVFVPLASLPLRSLRLAKVGDGFTDASIARVASVATLVSLHVSSAVGLVGATLASLRAAPALHTLSLSWLSFFDAPRHLPALSSHPTLEQLWLEYDTKVGDEACAVAASIPALTSLQLQGSKRLTDAGLAILHAHPALKHIALPTSKYAKKVSRAGVDALAAARPGCTVYRG